MTARSLPPLDAQQRGAVLEIRPLLRWYVGRFLRVCPTASPYLGDLTQDAWEAACRAAQHWCPERGPLAHYAGVAIHRALWEGYFRAIGKGANRAPDVDVEEFLRHIPVPPEQEDVVMRGEARRLYASLGERLTANMRVGVRDATKRKAVRAYVRHLNGESGADIGRALRCSRQAANKLLDLAEAAALRWAADFQRKELHHG